MKINPIYEGREPVCNCAVGACPYLKRVKRIFGRDLAVCEKLDLIVHWKSPCVPGIREQRDAAQDKVCKLIGPYSTDKVNAEFFGYDGLYDKEPNEPTEK